MGELLSERGEPGVPVPSDPGGVTQLEGTVGRQLRKASTTSGGSPELFCSGARGEGELSLELMSGSAVSLSPSALLICVGAWGCLFWKSLSASSACRSFQSTHWLSESGYPFHLIRYWTLRPLPYLLASRTRSTSYSSSPSIRSGGGCAKFGPWKSVSW